MNKFKDIDIFYIDYNDIKNSSIYIEEHYLKNKILNENEKNFLLLKSLETSNFFIFNLLNLENKNLFFEKMFDNLKNKEKNILNKIKTTTNNDFDIIKKYLKNIKKYEKIDYLDWVKLEKFFYILLYYENLIDELQTAETTYL